MLSNRNLLGLSYRILCNIHEKWADLCIPAAA
jgi:hypothetical protein